MGPDSYSRPFPEIPLKETLRYLGMKNAKEQEQVLSRLGEVTALLQTAAKPALVFRRFPLSISGDTISFAGLEIKSRALLINLKPCMEVFLMAATLGSGVDRLLTRLSLTSSFDMLLTQALCAACLEEVLDQEETALLEKLNTEGMALRPRFSPGYGDLPLTLQPELLSILKAGATIGLSVTDSLMLTPQKSVTALIGICPKQDKGKALVPCELCAHSDCGFCEREA